MTAIMGGLGPVPQQPTPRTPTPGTTLPQFQMGVKQLNQPAIVNQAAPPGMPSPPAMVNQSQFGPGNNLIGQQITTAPQFAQGAQQSQQQAGGLLGAAAQGIQQAGGTLDQAQQRFEGLGQNLPGFQGIPAGQFGQTPLTGQAQGAVSNALGGPSLAQAAQGQFQNLLDRASDARQLGTRDIGRSAAALGRIGSGQVTTELGNLEDRIQTGVTRGARDLAGQVAQADAQNQLARAGLGLGAQNQFFGQGQALRGEARGERGAELDDAFRRALLQQQSAQGLQGIAGMAGNLSGQLGQLGDRFLGLGGAQFGLGSALANELRGERGFQAGLDQQALNNRLRQFGLERGVLGDERAFRLAQSGQLGQFGFGGPAISSGDIGILNNLSGVASQGLQQNQQLGASQLPGIGTSILQGALGGAAGATPPFNPAGGSANPALDFLNRPLIG